VVWPRRRRSGGTLRHAFSWAHDRRVFCRYAVLDQRVMANMGHAHLVAVPINAHSWPICLFPALFALVVPCAILAHGGGIDRGAARVGATEFGRSYLSGLPWVLLGYSQTTVLPIAQLASLFGVYGLRCWCGGQRRLAGCAPPGQQWRDDRGSWRRVRTAGCRPWRGRRRRDMGSAACHERMDACGK